MSVLNGNLYNYLTGEFREKGYAPAIGGWVVLDEVPTFPFEFWKWDGKQIIDKRI
jgi:hypothetical protein